MNRDENLLVTLMEECAELQQAVSKAIRFGMDSCHPDHPGRSNEHDIMVEYYQLVAVMEMLNNSNVVGRFSAADEALVKVKKKVSVSKFQDVSEYEGYIKD